eukprot:augustus_masked-scaffold_5-processed-gene-0.38-mRNA-1 protein AED:0.01 eAED:0.01 QI:0/-1/0/1/-1/1/1/0/266
MNTKRTSISSLFDLSNSCVLITGASSGFGEHFAKVYINSGCLKLALLARRVEKLTILKEELLKLNPKAQISVQKFDVLETDKIPDMFDSVEKELGQTVNILVNNAGMSVSKVALKISPANYDRVMGVNLKSCYFLSQEFCKRVKNEIGNRSIINIASILSEQVQFGQSVYAMTKSGLKHMSEALQLEWFKYGIRVNTICPGMFITEINGDYLTSSAGKKYIEQYNIKRCGTLDELSGALLLLSTSAGSFMWGTDITVDGGQRLSRL